LNSKGKLEHTFLSVSSSHKSYNWRDRGGDPSVIHGQSPCQGVASPPPLLPEADSFSWMVIRLYGVGKLKLAPFLVFDRKLQN